METKEIKKPAGNTRADLPNFIASNLRYLRKSKGWSQTELATKVHLNRGNIASYESGSAEPSICKLLRISNLFEVNLRDITRRDFLEAGELTLAQHAYNDKRLQERERINHLRNRAMEMDELIRSSKRLFEYKRSGIENTCKEAEMFAAQYQQLHEITRQLMDEHRSLLGEVGCQCE